MSSCASIGAGRSGRSSEQLVEWGVRRFADVGMGIELVDGQLGGILRVTTVTPGNAATTCRLESRSPRAGTTTTRATSRSPTFNALNAALAVIRWKKHFGFYRDYEKEHNSTYTIDCNMLLGGDMP